MKVGDEGLVRTRGVGVVVPARNEENLLGDCLAALEHALTDIESLHLRRAVVVVLDSCQDRSFDIARAWKMTVRETSSCAVTIAECAFRNVGRARSLGFDVLLEHFEDLELAEVWLATSDADSQVPKQWLRAQLRARAGGADAWAGRVTVTDWSSRRRAIAEHWRSEYETEEKPIHGANLGVSARIYTDVGGFPPIRSSEDRELHSALESHGARVCYDRATPVVTSARRLARAPEGFAAALTRIGIAAIAT